MHTSDAMTGSVVLAEGLPWEAKKIWLLLGVIAALAVLLGFVALWLRRRLLTPDEQPPVGFTLKDLRAMHAEGQLSDEELARAEEKALARTRSHYLGLAADPPEEPEDIGHLSTGSEDDPQAGTENTQEGPDKNRGGEAEP